MINLNNPLFSHFGGSLIYVPLTNSIFCLGGYNSKKCEFYKNDKLLNNKIPALNSSNFQDSFWYEAPEFNISRMDFSSIVINRFIYVFFGHVKSHSQNLNSIERLNLIKNESWELINLKNNLGISYNLMGNGVLAYNESEVLLLGGSDEKGQMRDTIFLFNSNSNIIRKFEYKIPDIKWKVCFNFKKESNFMKINCFDCNNTKMPKYLNIDGLNRVHLVNTNLNRFEYNFKEEKVEI